LWFAEGSGTLGNTDVPAIDNLANNDPDATIPGGWALLWPANSTQALSNATTTLSTSGNEISDATRTAVPVTSGDGRPAESSFGIWAPTTNLVTNGSFETNTTGWTGV